MSIADDRHSPALGRYLAGLRGLRGLSLEEELALAHRIRAGCAEAAEELTRANLGIVVQIAKRYRNLGIAFEDLLAEGNVGLVEAARRFDPGKGNKFITYAVWWIRRAILKALNEQTTIVRVSYHHKRKLRQIRRAERELTRTLQRKPDREELSGDVHETVERLERVLRRGTSQVGLDEPLDQDAGGERWVETLPCRSATSAEDALIRRETDRLLARAIERLPDNERRVVEDRYGLSGRGGSTLKEIGERMNLSRERVRQIEAEACERLRRVFARAPRGGSAA